MYLTQNKINIKSVLPFSFLLSHKLILRKLKYILLFCYVVIRLILELTTYEK